MIFVVAGLGYGDEGKGSVVDYLVREHRIENVVRYNGGSQAGHNVVSPEGRHHCFSQFGSGTLVPGVKTFLSKYMLIDPLAIEVEEGVLREKGVSDGFARLFIDKKCPVITPFNIIINRMQEVSRGDWKHGSCGKGIGQTAADRELYGQNVLLAGDLSDEKISKRKLDFFWRLRLDLAEQLVGQQPLNKALLGYLEQLRSLNVSYCVEHYRRFSEKAHIIDESVLLQAIKDGNAIFEGAQGALLDMEYGFWPYVTRTSTTFSNAHELIGRSGCRGKVLDIGVLRAYGTRHGRGPFVAENRELTAAVPACHNDTNDWQGSFRLGWFDLVAASYGLDMLGGVDEIFLTNLDRLSGCSQLQVCKDYRPPKIGTDRLEKFFVLGGDKQGQTIRSIKLLKSQRDGILANLLTSSSPVFQKVDGWNYRSCKAVMAGIEDYVDFLEKELGVPIPIVSVGPSSEGKIRLKPAR